MEAHPAPGNLFYYRRVHRQLQRLRWLLATSLSAAVGLLALTASSSLAQGPAPGAPVVVDGPSPQILSLSGLSVARDGTGGLVYLKQVSGVAHVFVSRLAGGTLRAPERLDGPLGSPSSQPVIAAGDGGLLLIAFINAGQLFTVECATASARPSPPAGRFGGASDPSMQLTPSGRGYLAFTAAGGGGHDVRAAYYHAGRWALEASPLNAVAGDDAGAGSGRPRVAAAGDGVAIVVWGEGGHVYSRRVWRTSPSVVYERADVPSLSGSGEVSADQPSVAVGGDSSYANIAFHEVLANGSQKQSRVLMNRLRGSQYDGVTQPDGLSTPAPSGADQPQVATTEYGRGLVTSARDDSNELFATLLESNGASGSLIRVDSLHNATAPYAIPAIAGLFSYLVAWQHDPGALGTPEIRARYFSGSDVGGELVMSSPSLGATDAADGLLAAGDIDGDATIAWVQEGAGGAGARIVAAQLYQPPRAAEPVKALRYSRSAHPVLAWRPARKPEGAVAYLVSLDGAVFAGTAATSVTVPRRLADGPHPWQVTTVNRAGLRSTSQIATVWVDTVPPTARLTLTGARRARSSLHAYLSYTDAPPPPEPAADASGIGRVVVNWGDGSIVRAGHRKSHAYKRSGRYRVTVTVADRAGNVARIVRYVTIAPAARGRPRPKHAASAPAHR